MENIPDTIYAKNDNDNGNILRKLVQLNAENSINLFCLNVSNRMVEQTAWLRVNKLGELKSYIANAALLNRINAIDVAI